jgi:hypothetical protein
MMEGDRQAVSESNVPTREEVAEIIARIGNPVFRQAPHEIAEVLVAEIRRSLYLLEYLAASLSLEVIEQSLAKSRNPDTSCQCQRAPDTVQG